MTAEPPPALLCVFNRPEVTRRAVDALRAAGVTRLHVHADGPRPDEPGDAARCEEVRSAVEAIDWPCEVRTSYRDTNVGLQRAMVSALDWFFDEVEAGIVLEDDCLPSHEWFPFAGELLERYADEPRVMHISASNLRDDLSFSDASYVFAEVGHIWGWATWRRAWDLYDGELAAWPSVRADHARHPSPLHRALGRKFASAHAGRKRTWSRAWYFTLVSNDGLAVVPAVNLVENVGDDADATHRSGRRHPLRRPVARSLGFPLVHPTELVADAGYERHLARYHARSYVQRTLDRAHLLADTVRRPPD